MTEYLVGAGIDPRSRFASQSMYEAAQNTGRRKRVSRNIKSADNELRTPDRDTVTKSSLELNANFAVCAWTVRRHLDYVSAFNFQALTESDTLNDTLNAFIESRSKANQFDVTGRHSRQAMTRLVESLCVGFGDCLPVKISNGKVWLVEGDRIRNPKENEGNNGRRLTKADREKFVNGVQISKQGRAQRYAVNTRKPNGGYVFDKFVQATNAWHLGYFERYDQVRGVSPMLAALNLFRDAHESINYALAKMKLSQIFGLVIYTEDGEGLGEGDLDFSGGPITADMSLEDRIEMLEAKTPAPELQAFLEVVINAALKCLDIPYSHYNESFTNFFGSKMAQVNYVKACGWKRERLRQWLLEWATWRINVGILRGELVLPRGMTATDLKFDFVPSGVPWWDTSKEVTAAEKMLDLGLTSRGRIFRMIDPHGGDVREVWRELERENEDMRKRGLLESTADPERYGQGVRAGVLTPQADDEAFIREQMGLPQMSQVVVEDWTESPDRRPVTLQPDDEEQTQHTTTR